MKIVFLLTHVPNPRINKRLMVASECGSVTVICTRRKSQDIYEVSLTNIKHIILDVDLPSSIHLIKRFLISQKYQKYACKYLSELKPDLIYAEGMDSLMIANKYRFSHGNVRVFFEVADLRECFIKKPQSIFEQINARLVANIEKKNFRDVDTLILTSMKFYDVHYKKLIAKDKVLYMPNIPDTVLFAKYKKKSVGKFTVGFIGGIRYLHQMKMLVDTAEEADCNVLFAGAGGTADDYREITEYCNGKKHVTFTGKYSYNDDIAELYGMIDCVYSVYDANNMNVRIALPNKLYEAVYCELPIIVAKNTYLSEIVEEWGVGVAVSCNDAFDLTTLLKKLAHDTEYYLSFVKNCRIKKPSINFMGYHDNLKRKLKESR